jgi:hypothetical protein
MLLTSFLSFSSSLLQGAMLHCCQVSQVDAAAPVLLHCCCTQDTRVNVRNMQAIRFDKKTTKLQTLPEAGYLSESATT